MFMGEISCITPLNNEDKIKDRNVKQVGWVLVEGGRMNMIHVLYNLLENRTMKPVEIVVNRGVRDKRMMVRVT
jgi:hypothetical protein